jgi:hypothetical protein
MSFSSELENEIAELARKRNTVLKKVATKLYTNLVEASPEDTGELKRGWQPPVEISTMTFLIANIAPHALIIDGGRRQIPFNGKLKWIGSERLKQGYKPIVDRAEKTLNGELQKL